MAVTRSIRVSGLEKLAKRYEDNRLVQVPMRRFFWKSTSLVHKGVTRRTRKFTGEARASVQIAIDPAAMPRWGKVFSTLFRMRFLEYGTKPHSFPVTAQFAAYARRKKRDPYQLMRAIATRGTKGRFMFRKTARGTRRQIFRNAREAVLEIKRNLDRR